MTHFLKQTYQQLKQRQIRGVALLMVLFGITLMTAIVVDLGDDQMLNYRLAIQERDALRAEALAESGLELSRLMLMVQSKIQTYFAQMASSGMQLPILAVWDVLPIDSNAFKGLASGEFFTMLGLPSAAPKEPPKVPEQKNTDKDKKEAPQPPKTFGSFEGAFSVEIVDEESKISLRKWASATDPLGRKSTAKKLYSLFQPPEYDMLFDGTVTDGKVVDRWSLIGNIYDWIDDDDLVTDPRAEDREWGRVGSGSERALYGQYKGVEPKNAYFDSVEELRLVHGMSDAHMAAFSDAITLYGENDKVNLLTAGRKVLGAMIRYCAVDDNDMAFKDPGWMKDTLLAWDRYRKNGEGPITPAGFATFLQLRPLKIDATRCQNAFGMQSQNYIVRSTGTVGDVSRTLTMVARVVLNAEDFYYFSAN